MAKSIADTASGTTEKIPLHRLITFVAPLLKLEGFDAEMRRALIHIADTEEATNKVYTFAENVVRVRYHRHNGSCSKLAAATRWLCIIKRDYGPEEFRQLTEKLS
jgi:hypothetical protein